MPVKAQIDLLEEFIGENGIYFSTISENKELDLGTKLLYLERAISWNCHKFLASLDNLYNPRLVGEAKMANIEFIRALKLINDFCFNHQVKNLPYPPKSALTHYFGSLGPVNPADFEDYVQTNIRKRMESMQEGSSELIDKQKHQRKIYESTIDRYVEWREILDLPDDQKHRFMLTITELLNVTEAGENFKPILREVKI